MARVAARARGDRDGEAPLNDEPASAGSASARFPQIPESLWPAISACPSRLLVLDYDGTLAPFRTVRAEARMPPRTRAALERIVAGGRTRAAIVSGRPLDSLCALTEGLAVHRVGEHGWDELPVGGPVHRQPLPARAEWALGLADDEAAAHGWSAHVERKRTARALHTRGMEADAAAELTARVGEAWRSLAARQGLVVRAMAAGLELRVPGVDKGTVLEALLAGVPDGTVVAFVGDDDTDEDAFRRVAPIGYAIRVGPASRGSLANAGLDSVDHVTEFLERWEAATTAAAESRA